MRVVDKIKAGGYETATVALSLVAECGGGALIVGREGVDCW